MTPLQTAWDRLSDARSAYASDNGDGFSDRDWQGANDYTDEGYGIGVEALSIPEEDREDWIEEQVGLAGPESAWHLISWAATYRLAELIGLGSVMERAA